MNGTFLIVLLVAVVAGIIYASVVAQRRRRLVLKVVAKNLGLGFDPTVYRQLHHDYEHSLFRKGSSRRATNNMYGTMTLAGYPVGVLMGDYRYETGSGDNRQVHSLSYALFQLPFVGTPDLLIRREHLGDKLLGGIGFDDIDFESEEFSRTFWVKSSNKKYAYDVIHPKMMEFLLGGPTPHIEIVNDVCLILEGTRRWDPETFQGAPGWFQAFLKRWPEHLTDRLYLRG
jgi:hypothetical protein